MNFEYKIAKPSLSYRINDQEYQIPKNLKFIDKQYMMKEYKLDRLYLLLQTIKKIFEKNNIKYFAIAGTLLSAIRHKAFMPWDDDIDLSYMRKDHDKIKSLTNKFKKLGYTLYECTPGFVLQDINYNNICADLFCLSTDKNHIYKYDSPIINDKPTFNTYELFPKEYYYQNEIDKIIDGKICDITIPIFSNSIDILKRCYSENVMTEVRGVASTKIHMFRRFQFIIPIMENYLPTKVNFSLSKFLLK